MSEALKQQIADCIRMMVYAQHIDFNGHVSARLPDSDYILINDRRASRGKITKEEIITIDLKGNVIGDGEPPNEYPLHTHIYKHRKDVQAVGHTHPQWSTFFTIADVPLIPVVIQGAVLGEIPLLPKSDSISTPEVAEEMVQTLGDAQIVLLKNHGAAITGDSVRDVFVRSVFLEENAYRQYMASQIGNPKGLSRDEIEKAQNFLWKDKNIQKVWDNYLSKITDV